jgi:hypothetical protein
MTAVKDCLSAQVRCSFRNIPDSWRPGTCGALGCLRRPSFSTKRLANRDEDEEKVAWRPYLA